MKQLVKSILFTFLLLQSCSNITITTSTTTTTATPTKLIRLSGYRGDKLDVEIQTSSYRLGTDFGVIYSNASVKRQFTISNIGTSTLHFSSSPKVQGTSFSIEGNDISDILPQERKRLTITFSPTSIGDYTASLIVNSDATNSPYFAIPLHGKCIQYGNPAYFTLSVRHVAKVISYDANSDGNLDILAWEGDNNPPVSILHVYINDGAGNFTDQTTSVISFDQNFPDGVPTTFRYIDLLNEGKVGVLIGVLGFEDSDGPYGGKIHYLYQGDNGQLDDRTDLFGSYWGQTEDLDVADLYSDGNNEIYITNCPGGHNPSDAVILKKSGSIFTPTYAGMTPEMQSMNAYFNACSFLDIAGMGYSDLFLGFRNSYYIEDKILDTFALNDGRGSFALSRTGLPNSRYSVNWNGYRSYSDDIDGDGIADLVEVLMPYPWSEQKMSVKVFLNNCNMQFSDGSNGLPEFLTDYCLYSFSGIDAVEVIDANHDGFKDMLFTGNCLMPTLWVNQGGNGFICDKIITSDIGYPQTVMPGDFNGDDVTDYVLVYNDNS